MKLKEETKKEIISVIAEFEKEQYGNLTMAERKKNGVFYTPGELVIKMIEKFSNLDGNILDPCVGAGNLLVGMIIAGADPKKCYGIELIPEQAELCRDRLEKYGVPRENIITGSCFDEDVWNELECLTKS